MFNDVFATDNLIGAVMNKSGWTNWTLNPRDLCPSCNEATWASPKHGPYGKFKDTSDFGKLYGVSLAESFGLFDEFWKSGVLDKAKQACEKKLFKTPLSDLLNKTVKKG
jgi:hypothetical protein